MRKAFDANVPKLKPRLRTSNPLSPTGGEGRVRGQPVATTSATASAQSASAPAAEGTPRSASGTVGEGTSRSTSLSPTGGEGRVRGQSTTSPGPAPRQQVIEATNLSHADAPSPTVTDRRERLEKIKRRVAEASRPGPAAVVSPADPARAAESVLGLVRDLEVDLARAREREEALRADLEASRAEATRAGAEARQAVERLSTAEGQLEEKRGVLADLLAEMGALETERDEALRRSQALAALDEERAKLLEDLGRRAEEEGRLRAEREAEVERLSEELRAGAADGARLRAALAQLARERDEVAGELDRTRRERDELGSAKRALEQVHTALAQARARLG